MKNIYELSPTEKDKNRREFNKLRFTKDVNLLRNLALLFSFLSSIASVILSGLIEDGMNLQVYANMADIVGIISLFLFLILSFYLNIAFMRWMKIKHDVEY